MHRPIIGPVAAAFVASACLAAGAEAATITMVSDTARWADATGFSGWMGASAQLYSNATPTLPMTATRPNGQSSWDRNWSDNIVAYGPGWGFDPTMQRGVPLANRPTASEVNNWSRDNFRGSWTIGWEGSVLGIDTTPAFVASNSRTYAQLSSGSIAAFLAARAHGTTGTLHLDLAQTVESYGALVANVLLYSPTSIGADYTTATQIGTGSSLGDFQIGSPLAADTVIRITLATVTSSTVGDHTVRIEMDASTWYGGLAAPAPGALALLGIAGLGARRRR